MFLNFTENVDAWGMLPKNPESFGNGEALSESVIAENPDLFAGGDIC